MFTYTWYRNLIDLLRNRNYKFVTYTNYDLYNENIRKVIFRHDIDFSLEKSQQLAKIEMEYGVFSTYFVLLTSNLYNPFCKQSINLIREIANYGHEIGLHFDETEYDDSNIVENIKKEAKLLEEILGKPIKTVSMHRPSKNILDCNLQIPGMINTYDKKFFKEFKYVSDSRCEWREPIESLIKSEAYQKFCILTHAFWYEDEEKNMGEKIIQFINKGNLDRYDIVNKNFRDLDSVMKKSDVC